jgi:uncharacterized membrane protein
MDVDVAQSVEIRRPAAEVFDYLSHGENLPRWMDEFETVEQVTDGAPAKGTKYRYKMRTRGKIDSTFEWSEYEPGRKLAWHGERVSTALGSLEPQGVWQLGEREGGRTELSMTMQPKTGGLRTLLRPLMARSIRKEAPANLRRLKELLEGGG